MDSGDGNFTPVFSAACGSAKQLFQILRCISFGSKAHVRITREGLRFTVEESQVMQGKLSTDHASQFAKPPAGIAFLDKALFTTYQYSPMSGGTMDTDQEDEDAEIPPFQISLFSLLETLQIFGINDASAKDRWSSRNGATGSSFDARPLLGISGLCRLSYPAPGDSLCVTLEEAGVTTTCELTTYEPLLFDEIPLQKDAIVQKIILRANWLRDAIQELSSTSPTRLTMASSPQAPYFTLSSTGPLGSATVEFSKDPQLLETFQVPRRTVNTYKYSMIKGTDRAMAAASKVSVRSDEQGVLSLQFMIETCQEGRNSGFAFVDFRFVPYLEEPEDIDGDSQDEEAVE